MRRLIGFLAVALIFVTLTAESNSCTNKNNNGGAKPATANSAAAPGNSGVAPIGSQGTTAPAKAGPGLGDTVKVGDLDLVVKAVHTVDTKQFNQFNTADTAVDIDITNARGDSYTFNAHLGMKLVDTNGVAHDPELGCDKCPNELSRAVLVKGGHASGSVYYKMAGASPVSVLYQAIGSTNKATIRVTP